MDKRYDSPSKVSTVWGRHHGRLLPINIQYTHFFSVVQSPFDNWHSSFSPATIFEIDVYICSNALHDQSLGTRMGTWNAQVRCINAVAMTSHKATNRPHPTATSFTLALWQQHWKATNRLFMTVWVFDFRCYSLEKQKCCECFASIDGDKGDGIYCVKYVQLIINTPFFHRGFLCIPRREQGRGKAFFLTLEWSLKLLRKLMAN